MSPIEKVLMHLRSAMGDTTHKRKGTHADEEVQKRSRKTENHEPMDEDTKEELMMDLYEAVQKGDQSEVQRLLGLGMGINALLHHVSRKSKTALSLSVKHPKLLKFLLDAKANINLQDDNGQTALWNACIMGQHDAAELLIKAGADVDLAAQQVAPILVSIQNETPAILELLIANSANVNQPNDIGETALIHAARYEKSDFMQVLVEAGADILHQTKSRDTAFLYVDDSLGDDKWNPKPDVRKMIHTLTSHTGIDALNHFHTVVDVQRDDKRQQAEWRASRARKAVLQLPKHARRNPLRDACSMDYFGKQCEGNCWTYAALGMVVKFLQNDTKLYQAHPFLGRYQERLAATHPLLNSELISRNPMKYLGHKVWHIYGIMRADLKLPEQPESISYENTTIDGGYPVDFLVSLLLCARYRVTLKGFDHLGSTKIQIDGRSKPILDRKLKLREDEGGKDKIIQEEASPVQKFLRYTSEYLIIRSKVKITKNHTTVLNHAPWAITERIFTESHNYPKGFSFAELVQLQIRDIHTAGILHRLCGAILEYLFDPHADLNDHHAILLGFCNGKVIICDSNGGTCISDKGIDSILKKGDQTVTLSYVFSPDHVRFPGKFSVGDDHKLAW